MYLGTLVPDLRRNPSMRRHRKAIKIEPINREDCPMRSTPAATSVADPITAAIQLLRLSSVMQVTGLCRSSIYQLVSQHKFPAPVQLVGRAVAWRRSEVDTWAQSRPTISH